MLPYFTRIKRYVIKPTCENFSSFCYFFYEKTVKMHSAFLYSFVIGCYFSNYSKTIIHQAEIFKRKLSTIVIFIPCKLCVCVHFSFLVLPMLCRGFNEDIDNYFEKYLISKCLLFFIPMFRCKTKLAKWRKNMGNTEYRI